MRKAPIVSPLSFTGPAIHSVPLSALLAWCVVLLIFVSIAEAAVTCGEPGFQNFAANGDDLRAAALCYVLGTNCGSVGGSKTAVQATYGDDISYWCTGLVTDFNSVFRNMNVCDLPSQVMLISPVSYCCSLLTLDLQLATLLEYIEWDDHV